MARDLRGEPGCHLPPPDWKGFAEEVRALGDGPPPSKLDGMCGELYGFGADKREERPGEFFGASDELSPEEARLVKESRKPR